MKNNFENITKDFDVNENEILILYDINQAQFLIYDNSEIRKGKEKEDWLIASVYDDFENYTDAQKAIEKIIYEYLNNIA